MASLYYLVDIAEGNNVRFFDWIKILPTILDFADLG